MVSFTEMNKKVEISIGLILTLIAGTFLVTSFYLEVVTIEERMDTRYDRIIKKFDVLEAKINEIHEEE